MKRTCLLLQTWLDEFLDVDCSNEVFEVGAHMHLR